MCEKKSRLSALLFLALLLTACRMPAGLGEISLGEPEPVAVEWPHSTFVPPRALLEARVNEPLLIETYHASRWNKLGALTLFVNEQPLVVDPATAGNPDGQAAIFPSTLATLAVLRGNERIQSAAVAPPLPTSAWPVSLVWIGHIPGRYVIKMIVTDDKGNQSDFAVQPVEVR